MIPMKKRGKIHTSTWQAIFTGVILAGAMMCLFTMCTEVSKNSIKVSTLNNVLAYWLSVWVKNYLRFKSK